MNRSGGKEPELFIFVVFGLMEMVNDRFCTRNHSLHRLLHMVNHREMNRIILLPWYLYLLRLYKKLT